MMLMAGRISSAQTTFLISGNLSGLKEPASGVEHAMMAKLSYTIDNKSLTDSAVVSGGKFSFKGTVASPARAIIRLFDNNSKEHNREDYQEFYLENGTTTITGNGNIHLALIRGGAVQQDWLSLQQQMKPLNDRTSTLMVLLDRQRYKEKGALRDSLIGAIRSNAAGKLQAEEKFILSHPDSYVSICLLGDRFGIVNPEKMAPLYHSLSARMQQSGYGKTLGESLEKAINASAGHQVIGFTQYDTAGNTVTLQDYKGKFLLIDFWASWCGACRQENPYKVAAYHNFKDRNFDMVSISLDKDRQAWVKAVKEDGLIWKQASDLKGGQNKAAKDYGINAVPQNVLVSPEGIIIARNLSGEGMQYKLQEILPAAAEKQL